MERDGHPARQKNSGSSYDNWHGQVEEKPSTTEVTINHHLSVGPQPSGLYARRTVMMGPPGRSGPRPASKTRGLLRKRSVMLRPPSREGLRGLLAGKATWSPGWAASTVGGSSAGMAIPSRKGLRRSTNRGFRRCLASTPPNAPILHVGRDLYPDRVLLGGLRGARRDSRRGGRQESKKLTGGVTVSNEQIERVSTENAGTAQARARMQPAWVAQVLQGVMIPTSSCDIRRSG